MFSRLREVVSREPAREIGGFASLDPASGQLHPLTLETGHEDELNLTREPPGGQVDFVYHSHPQPGGVFNPPSAEDLHWLALKESSHPGMRGVVFTPEEAYLYGCRGNCPDPNGVNPVELRQRLEASSPEDYFQEVSKAGFWVQPIQASHRRRSSTSRPFAGPWSEERAIPLVLCALMGFPLLFGVTYLLTELGG